MILESLTIPIGFDTGLLLEGLNLIKGGLETVGNFLKDSTEEAMAAQEVNTQLEAVLKSTGGAAGVTAEMAQELASRYQGLTRFSDETILSAENMLLTFTSIGKDVFPQATETVLNMSQALGQDTKASAIQLGKALNDPIQGVTALRRVGIQFTDEQENMIKSLVESGDLLGAQTLILKELEKEFGGSAVAAGQTFGGQLDILKNKLSDVKERIGGALLPVLGEFASRFATLIDSPAFQAVVDAVVTKLTELGDWIVENLPVLEEKFNSLMTEFKKLYDENIKPIIDDWSVKWQNLMTNLLAWWESDGAEAMRKAEEGVVTAFTEINKFFTEADRLLNLLGVDFESSGSQAKAFEAILILLLSPLTVLVASLRLVNFVLTGLVGIFFAIRGAVASVTSAVWGLINALARLSIPWWLTPGSPTPLENGLRGITSAMKEMGNAPMLPNIVPNNKQASMGATGGGSGIDYIRLTRIVETAVERVAA